MTVITCQPTIYKKAAETRNVLVSFADALDVDSSINETISSVTSVVDTPSDLTIGSEAVTTAARKVNGKNVPARKAISFSVSGGSAGTYTIVCTVATSGSQTIARNVTLVVTES